MKTFKLQVVIGNQLIVVEGATGYKITDAIPAPKIQSRAPNGGKTVHTVKTIEPRNVALIIHEIPVKI